jgi:hypothetical protein
VQATAFRLLCVPIMTFIPVAVLLNTAATRICLVKLASANKASAQAGGRAAIALGAISAIAVVCDGH